MIRRIATIAVLLAPTYPAHADVAIEFGPNFVQEQYTESQSLLIQKIWQDKYAVGIGYMSSHCLDNEVTNVKCNWDIPEQFMLGAERRFGWKRWSFNIGLYYVDGVSRISSTYWNIRSSLEFEVTQSTAFKLSHLSNGGIGRSTTDCNTNGTCVTGDFNLGINTLLFVWRF